MEEERKGESERERERESVREREREREREIDNRATLLHSLLLYPFLSYSISFLFVILYSTQIYFIYNEAFPLTKTS